MPKSILQAHVKKKKTILLSSIPTTHLSPQNTNMWLQNTMWPQKVNLCPQNTNLSPQNACLCAQHPNFSPNKMFICAQYSFVATNDSFKGTIFYRHVQCSIYLIEINHNRGTEMC